MEKKTATVFSCLYEYVGFPDNKKIFSLTIYGMVPADWAVGFFAIYIVTWGSSGAKSLLFLWEFIQICFLWHMDDDQSSDV